MQGYYIVNNIIGDDHACYKTEACPGGIYKLVLEISYKFVEGCFYILSRGGGGGGGCKERLSLKTEENLPCDGGGGAVLSSCTLSPIYVKRCMCEIVQ